MGSRSLTAQANLRGVDPNAPSAATGTLLRYRLNVIAADVADVVQSVGGWLCDRSMAGWEINVLLAEDDDLRPLRILGARTVPLHPTLSSLSNGAERAAGLAIASGLLGTDERIDAHLSHALRCGDVEIASWGGSRSSERVEYRLSAAARIFKAHALTAAMLTDVRAASFETLFRSGYRPVDSHLIPVG